MVKVNLSDKIRFRVRPKGVEVWNAHYASLGMSPPPLLKDGERPGDRLIEMHIWEFAQIFGPALYMGCDPPVDTEVEIGQS